MIMVFCAVFKCMHKIAGAEVVRAHSMNERDGRRNCLNGEKTEMTEVNADERKMETATGKSRKLNYEEKK